MTLVAAAVCPHPPLLVPQVAGGAEQVDVLASARTAVRRLLAAEPDLVVVVGDAPRTGRYDDGAVGTLAGFGVDVQVCLSEKADGSDERLPLSITIGAWLLGDGAWRGPSEGWGVASDATPTQAAAVGARLVEATADRSVGLLVMGDGSARRTLKAPGYLDDRAAPHDQAVARALASVDAAALLALDPSSSAELAAAGRASWQVLAGAVVADAARPDGAAAAAQVGNDTHVESWHGHLLYDDAPYGVGYLVAVWERGVRSTWP